MKKSVVILNDELGTMALGFSRAGYDIGAIYIDFLDSMNLSVCEKNWGTIIRDISLIGTKDNECVLSRGIDCVAGRINTSFDIVGKKDNRMAEINPYSPIEYVIQEARPKCIIVQCLGINKKSERYSRFCKKLVDSGYYVKEENIETGVITGFPVKERISILFGALNEEDINLEFLKNIEHENCLKVIG